MFVGVVEVGFLQRHHVRGGAVIYCAAVTPTAVVSLCSSPAATGAGTRVSAIATSPTCSTTKRSACSRPAVRAAGKAAIFIPFPRATDDHQRRNAEALVRAKAALLLPETELTPDTLVDHVKTLLCQDRARLAAMAQAAKTMAHPNAAYEIATTAARLAGFAEPSAQQRSV